MIHVNGTELQRVMAERRMSHRQLATAIGWGAHSRVSRLVHGQAKSVTAEQAQRIADALQVEVPFLFVPAASTKPSGDAHKDSRIAA
jgi:transcriptional regulator with XRE-family HTH domain